MKFHQVRTFLAVYQERSFTGAAQAIHATQSGVSVHIRELEATLRVRLFEREASGVVPTLAGKHFYEHAKEIMRQISEAREEMAAFAGTTTGKICAGLIPTLTRSALAPALDRFCAQFPHVEVTVAEHFSGTLRDMVANGNLDFAILPSGESSNRLYALQVMRDCELFVTRAGDGTPHLSPIRLADARPLKLIMPLPDNARRGSLDAYLKNIKAPIASILEMDSMLGALDLIARSDWTAILPATLCAPDFDGQQRWLHPLSDPPLLLDLSLVTEETTTLSLAARAFTEELIASVEEIQARWSELVCPGGAMDLSETGN